MTVSFDKKLGKGFTGNFDQELRLFDNMSRVNLTFSNFSVDYKVSKVFKVSLAYRFILKNQDTYYSKRHRVYADFTLHDKFKKLNLAYRLRLQGQERDIFSSDKGTTVESYMRHKFTLEYNCRKFTPYVAAEFRFQFYNPHQEVANGQWNRGRYYVGTEYELSKKNVLNGYFMLQRDYNVLFYQADYTWGVQYSHSF